MKVLILLLLTSCGSAFEYGPDDGGNICNGSVIPDGAVCCSPGEMLSGDYCPENYVCCSIGCVQSTEVDVVNSTGIESCD
jgi:hypothetical protein